MRCDFWGHQFDASQALACRGCALQRSCHLVRCPRCGYEMPQEPRLVRLWRAWRKRK